jgi:hypothetical protein
MGVGLLAVAVLAVLEGFVLVEMIRQVAQLRHRLNLDDRPMPTSIGEWAGRPVPDFAVDRIGGNLAEAASIVVFLSTDCTTCRTVATELGAVRAKLPDEPAIVPVIEGRSDEDLEAFFRETGLADDRVVRDDGELGYRLGMRIRPLAVVVRHGTFADAAIVRNGAQLRQLASQIAPPVSGGDASHPKRRPATAHRHENVGR